jgi:hypothetical protein
MKSLGTLFAATGIILAGCCLAQVSFVTAPPQNGRDAGRVVGMRFGGETVANLSSVGDWRFFNLQWGVANQVLSSTPGTGNSSYVYKVCGKAAWICDTTLVDG